MKNFVTLELGEELNFYTFKKFEEEAITLLDKQYEFDILIVDFHKLEYIDAVGLGVILNIESLYKKIKKVVLLKNCNFIIKKHFELKRLDKMFNFYEDYIED